MVTLLILAYNEENFIEKTVRKYINEFKEIIIIDDSSKDRTYSIC